MTFAGTFPKPEMLGKENIDCKRNIETTHRESFDIVMMTFFKISYRNFKFFVNIAIKSFKHRKNVTTQNSFQYFNSFLDSICLFITMLVFRIKCKPSMQVIMNRSICKLHKSLTLRHFYHSSLNLSRTKTKSCSIFFKE